MFLFAYLSRFCVLTVWLADSISVWALVFVFFTVEWAPILNLQLRRFWNLELGFGQTNWFFWKLKDFYHFELVFGEANWRRRFREDWTCPETEETLACPWRSELSMSHMGEVSGDEFSCLTSTNGAASGGLRKAPTAFRFSPSEYKTDWFGNKCIITLPAAWPGLERNPGLVT